MAYDLQLQHAGTWGKHNTYHIRSYPFSPLPDGEIYTRSQ
jgi:hypothetical protein